MTTYSWRYRRYRPFGAPLHVLASCKAQYLAELCDKHQLGTDLVAEFKALSEAMHAAAERGDDVETTSLFMYAGKRELMIEYPSRRADIEADLAAEAEETTK